MDKNKNYYEVLGVTHNSTNNEIKKAYYSLSKQYHPDKNKDIDTSLFNSITEAYDVFCNGELRKEYDMKSKYGKDYNEYYELFDITNDFSYNDGKEKFDKFKKYEVNNIDIVISDDFNSNIEYERWVKCKSCDGTGKNLSSKIIIRDNNGNIMKIFRKRESWFK
jgi:curved DNA-binding protein CbpA